MSNGGIKMSATNRGSKRSAYDFYATPKECIEKLLDNFIIEKTNINILEPSAGNGNIIKVLKEKGINGNITAIEIREEEYKNLLSLTDDVVINDFLQWNTNKQYDLIIGNPPFSLAKEFIEKCFKISNGKTKIVMLLRTSFLESKSRYDFWQKHPLNGLYVLSKRPSFTGKGTDEQACFFKEKL